MTKLECSAKNCVHYAEGCCCKSSITVDGAYARCADDTCCASFSENTGGVFKNLFKTPESTAADIMKITAAVQERSISVEKAPVTAERPAAVLLSRDNGEKNK
jgi:hypothetical protein